MCKINKISLRSEKSKGDASYLDAKIDENKNLILEGYDIGKSPTEFFGDSDYEYWVTVKKEFKDTLLLYLLKESFNTSSDFMNWLKKRNIPYEFFNWV